MSETIRLGHRLQFTDGNGNTGRKFQNWHVNESADGYAFLPFGFSGVTVSLEGDNVTSTLILPIDGLARSWTQQAIEEQWLAEIEVSLFSEDKDAKPTTLYKYIGQIASAGWDSLAIQLELNTVLDAVGFDVPRRQLHQKLVGRLPTSGSISLR